MLGRPAAMFARDLDGRSRQHESDTKISRPGEARRNSGRLPPSRESAQPRHRRIHLAYRSRRRARTPFSVGAPVEFPTAGKRYRQAPAESGDARSRRSRGERIRITRRVERARPHRPRTGGDVGGHGGAPRSAPRERQAQRLTPRAEKPKVRLRDELVDLGIGTSHQSTASR